MLRKKKLLFVCTANLQRSPTAEAMFKGSKKYEARSAGISPHSPQAVTQALVDWADIMFVFSEKGEGHKSFLLEKFSHLGEKKIIDLDIEDAYYRNDPELIRVLKEKLKKHLDK